MATTAGLLLLVGGPDPGALPDTPQQQHQLPEAVQTELGASWEQLRQLLERLAPEVGGGAVAQARVCFVCVCVCVRACVRACVGGRGARKPRLPSLPLVAVLLRTVV